MHRNVLGQFRAARVQGHDRANLGAVQVGGDFASSLGNDFKTTDRHVFADLGDQGATLHFQRFAVNFERQQGFEVGRLVLERSFSSHFGQVLEVFAFGDEVGFGVHFNQGNRIGVRRHGDNAFSSRTAAFLVSLGHAVRAQLFSSLVDVATGGFERFLAVAHASASALAEFLNL